MEENKWIVESIQLHYGRIIRALIIGWVASIILIVGGFLIYNAQYDYVGTTYSQDGQGTNNINTGTQGDVNGAEVNNSETDTPH